ncbi:hypothetical protein DFH09DRAFT_1162704 [Mycena vulgaris]|nr:hypothetical protein DFH09DRAFT_1162704 [Mycena vulgaris]
MGVQTAPFAGWALRVIVNRQSAQFLKSQLDDFLEYFLPEKIDGLTQRHYADYLLYILVLLGFTPSQRDLAWTEKSPNIGLLGVELFKILKLSLEEQTVDSSTVKRIVLLTGKIAAIVEHSDLAKSGKSDLYDLCAAVPRISGWSEVVLCILSLSTRSPRYTSVGYYDPVVVEDVTWVKEALHYLQQIWVSTGMDIEKHWENTKILLNALFDAQDLPKLSSIMFQFILQTLSGDPFISCEAFDMLCRGEQWFLDDESRLLMQENSIWSLMGDVARTGGYLLGDTYMNLAEKLAAVPSWEPYIYKDLPNFLLVALDETWKGYMPNPDSFCDNVHRLLHRVWGAYYTGSYQFVDKDQEILGLAFTALSNEWKKFDFAEWQATTLVNFVKLARCTSAVALTAHYTTSTKTFGTLDYKILSQRFRAIFPVLLAEGLALAAEHARSTTTDPPFDSPGEVESAGIHHERHRRFLTGAAEILEQLTEEVRSNPREASDKRYWDFLRIRLDAKIDALEKNVSEDGTVETP